jgi:hypothetical protein
MRAFVSEGIEAYSRDPGFVKKLVVVSTKNDPRNHSNQHEVSQCYFVRVRGSLPSLSFVTLAQIAGKSFASRHSTAAPA